MLSWRSCVVRPRPPADDTTAREGRRPARAGSRVSVGDPRRPARGAARSPSTGLAARDVAALDLPLGHHDLADRARHEPDGTDAALLISIVLVLAGVAIFAYARGAVVEADRRRRAHRHARGARRRRRDDRALSDHYIICGYGRVGRRVAEEFRDVGRGRTSSSTSTASAVEAARERRRPADRGQRHRRRRPRAARARARARPGRLGRLRRRQPLHHALGAHAPARPADRRARLRRGRGAQAPARRRRPRRPAVHRPPARQMANLVLKPQVAAFLDVGDDAAAAPTSASRRSRSRAACAQAGKTIRDLRDPRARPARSSSRCASTTAPSTRRPSPTPCSTTATSSSRSAPTTELRALEAAVRPARGRCRLDAARPARGAARRASRARRSSSSGRATPAHGDYATNVALRLARTRQAAAARDRRGARGRGRRARRGRARPRSPGRASSTSGSTPTLVRRGARARSSSGARLRRRLGRAAASACRSRWSPRTRPARSRSPPRGTAPTATRSRGCSSSPGHEVEREYYYNDAGAQMERFRASVEARRRGEEPPEDGYQGDVRRTSSRASRRRPGAARCCEQIEATLERFRIHFDSWARQSELEQRLRELLAAARHVRARRRALGALVGVRRRRGPRARSARRAGRRRRPTAPRTSSTSSTSSSAASTARSTCSAPTTTATRNWYAAVARMLGYDPERVEVLLYQLVHLTRGGERAQDVEAARRRRLPRRLHRRGRRRRGALVPRQPRPRPDDRDRRRPGGRAVARRTRSTTSSTRTRGSPAILRNAGDARGLGGAARAARRRGARARQAAADFPGVVAEATERRGPQAIPTYAIRVADDFHRFYHHHRVLGSEAAGVPARALRARRSGVIARCARPGRVEAPERM